MCSYILGHFWYTFFWWLLYGFKWKFRANLLLGAHQNQFFCLKRPLFDFFKNFYLLSGCDHEKWKNGPKSYFLLIECRETWSECSLHLFWMLKGVKTRKVSGNTVFWFFPVFPSVSNLIRICRPKLKFRTRFRKFGSIHEYRDHKKALLNGKYGQKVKDGIFWPKMLFLDFGHKTKN